LSAEVAGHLGTTWTFGYDIDANWKLIVDNFQENYHLRFVHARTGGRLPENNPFGYPSRFDFMGPHHTQTMSMSGGGKPKPVQGIGMSKIVEFAAADGLMGGPYAKDYCAFFPNLFVFGSGMSPFSLYVMPRRLEVLPSISDHRRTMSFVERYGPWALVTGASEGTAPGAQSAADAG
jgi:Ring hydroxylating alpha subunit (catalytic domain)